MTDFSEDLFLLAPSTDSATSKSCWFFQGEASASNENPMLGLRLQYLKIFIEKTLMSSCRLNYKRVIQNILGGPADFLIITELCFERHYQPGRML